MLKKYSYLSFLLIIYSTTYTMELTRSSSFFLPAETQHIIFSQALNKWHYNEKSFKEIAHIGASLQLTCKKFSLVTTVASYMQINDDNKNIFLIRAAQAGIPCLVHYAIAQKADLNCTENFLGYTPLSSAVRFNNYQCCRLILEAQDISGNFLTDVNKAETDGATNGQFTDMDYMPTGYRPIHLAAINNNIQITKLLIKHKADVNAMTCFLERAFDIAYKKPIENKELIDLLIQCGADIPLYIRKKMNEKSYFMQILDFFRPDASQDPIPMHED